ncbi:MAG: ATP-binding cassette domain-containing protein [Bacteroidales bacterium]|nr:ATP-binding cassette domain-containing protein [Bacteroidales bacterium]
MIAFKNVSFAYGAHQILQNVSFLIKENDKIGLIGRNGAGKTTLFELIVRHLIPSEGIIEIPKNVTVGYLPQHLSLVNTTSLWDETLKAYDEIINKKKQLDKLLNTLNEIDNELQIQQTLLQIEQIQEFLHYHNAETINERTEQVLVGLGFKRSDFERPTSEFSGGWRMRIELAKILLKNPNVLLLDEPTNHLDIESIQWLEDYLIRYQGAVIIVSHDIAFLDHITQRTIEIINSRIYDYEMPYSEFVSFRKTQIELQRQAFENQQKQIEQTERFIERFRYKATKARQVQSKIKQLEKLERIEIDEYETKSISLQFPPALHSGTVVCEAKELSKNYGTLQVINNIDFIITRGEKIALVGKNGEGKTTLVKIIKGDLAANGFIQLGYQVKIGYFAQNQDELLDLNKTIEQTVSEIAPADIRPKIRNILGYFLFSDDDVYKPINVLSGGERARVLLAKLLLEPVNFLLLDEPTNHLDVPSKRILKEAIKKYDGTVLIISHDREFLDGLVDKIWEINNGKIKEYDGDIWNFLKQKKALSLQTLFNRNESKEKNYKEKSTSNIEYLQKKELDKKIRKIETELEKTEQLLHTYEQKIQEFEKILNNQHQHTNYDYQMFVQYDKTKLEYEHLFKQWENLITEKEHLLNEKKLRYS